MAFADPEKNIRELMIGEDMSVVDIGSGSGAYAFAAAAAAPGGRVYAVDVQKNMLLKLKGEAARKHLRNIEILWADAEAPRGTRFADGIMQRAILSNTLFQIEHKEGLAKEVARILRKGGRLMVVDWTDSFGGLGPHPDHVITSTQAKGLFERFGFKVLKEFNAGDHHYGIIFERI